MSTSSGTINVIQNIIESPSDAAYGITVSNLGCDGKQQKFQVSGYAAGPGDPSDLLVPSNFVFTLSCEKNDDGDDDWDDTYAYDSSNSDFSPAMNWDGGNPDKFTFEIDPHSSAGGYSGCPYDADGVKFGLQLYKSGTKCVLPGPSGTCLMYNQIPTHDFQVLNWDTGDTYLHDDHGGSDQKYDVCRNN